MTPSASLAPAVTIRAALFGDAPRIGELWRTIEVMHAELHPDYFRSPRGASPPTLDLVRMLQDPHRLLAVADVGGVVAGLVHAQIYDTPPQPLLTQRRRVHIDTLIVDAQHRRRGLGRALLDQAGVWARHRGAAEVLLTLWSGNQAAERFYAALGFRQVNTCLAREV